jgi:hypothetical protein
MRPWESVPAPAGAPGGGGGLEGDGGVKIARAGAEVRTSSQPGGAPMAQKWRISGAKVTHKCSMVAHECVVTAEKASG